MFGDPWWRALQIHRVRFVTGWDALRYDWSRAEADAYMAAARAAGVEVLLGFGHSRIPPARTGCPRRASSPRVPALPRPLSLGA